MTAMPAEDFGRDEAHVTIFLRGGRTIEHHVQYAVGSIQCPLSKADLERKFTDLAEPLLEAGDISTVIDSVWKLDEIDDVGRIITAHCGGRQSGNTQSAPPA